MGGCVSIERTKHRTDGKFRFSKSRKVWGRTVTPVPGAPATNLKKKETEDEFRRSSADDTINNLVHVGPDKSVTAHNMHEIANENFHVTQLQNGHSQTASYAGSKEEAFFDSVDCLESDCDEDFLSAYGDFVPSAGNTLSYPGSQQGTPRPSVASLKDRMFKNHDLSENTPTLAPVEKKRKLRDFFMEKLPSEEGIEGAEPTITLEMESNRVPGSRDDDNAGFGNNVIAALTKATNGKHEASKALGDGDKDQRQDYCRKHTGKCCMHQLMPNVSFTVKRRSSNLAHRSKGKKRQ